MLRGATVAGMLLVLALVCPGFAGAQARTVGLEAPTCAGLPFDPARVRELFALELEVTGEALEAEASEAALRVSYDAAPCEPGATHYRLAVDDGTTVRSGTLDVSEVALATLPRVLALSLLETLRGDTSFDTTVAPSTRASAPSAPQPSTEQPPEVPDEPAPSLITPVARLGVLAFFRNGPDTGAVLTGARLALDFNFLDFPVSGRVDGAASFGPVAEDLVLAHMEVGATVYIRAEAVPGLVLRFGPHLWFGHIRLVNDENGRAVRRSGDLQIGMSLRVAADVRAVSGLDVLIEAEVGTNHEGANYDLTSGEPTGFTSAYWSLAVGLGIF